MTVEWRCRFCGKKFKERKRIYCSIKCAELQALKTRKEKQLLKLAENKMKVFEWDVETELSRWVYYDLDENKNIVVKYGEWFNDED